MHECDHRPSLPSYRDLLECYNEAFTRYQHKHSAAAAQNWRLAADLLDTALLMLPGRVNLGQIVATPGALDTLAHAEQLPVEFLLRHKHGDWGHLDPHDLQINEDALTRRGRIVSVYRTRLDNPLWVITDAGWEVSTLLVPEEY